MVFERRSHNDQRARVVVGATEEQDGAQVVSQLVEPLGVIHMLYVPDLARHGQGIDRFETG